MITTFGDKLDIWSTRLLDKVPMYYFSIPYVSGFERDLTITPLI